MKPVMYLLIVVMLLTGCTAKHGAMKVTVGPDGPWILTNDGAVYGYNGSAWSKKEDPGTADDIAVCGIHLSILTKPDAQGNYAIKTRDVLGGTWTTFPAIGPVTIKQLACDGDVPVALTTAPNQSVYKYDKTAQQWNNIHTGAKAISVINGYLFHLYPTTTNGNVWSRDIDSGPYTRWGEHFVADKVAGDANGYPWVATSATSNPLYKWDANKKGWKSAFLSGPVYDMEIQSYVRMFILSDPAIKNGGYSLYSHELYSGGWTTYSLPRY